MHYLYQWVWRSIYSNLWSRLWYKWHRICIFKNSTFRSTSLYEVTVDCAWFKHKDGWHKYLWYFTLPCSWLPCSPCSHKVMASDDWDSFIQEIEEESDSFTAHLPLHPCIYREWPFSKLIWSGGTEWWRRWTLPSEVCQMKKRQADSSFSGSNDGLEFAKVAAVYSHVTGVWWMEKALMNEGTLSLRLAAVLYKFIYLFIVSWPGSTHTSKWCTFKLVFS